MLQLLKYTLIAFLLFNIWHSEAFADARGEISYFMSSMTQVANQITATFNSFRHM